MTIATTQLSSSDPQFESDLLATRAQVLLAFGSREGLRRIAAMRPQLGSPLFLGCSTAGQVLGNSVSDADVCVTTLSFQRAKTIGHAVHGSTRENSYDYGVSLGQKFERDGLKAVFVLSEGLSVNGSDLVKGLSEALDPAVLITGGLAGDGNRFEQTFVAFQDEVTQGTIAAAGFYGEDLKVGCGSFGGWDSFGPERLVTKASGNQLFELDGVPALDLYKEYLGVYAAELPASGLLFPLSIQTDHSTERLVRTILSIDETSRSLTFAGDVPRGSLARLMKANIERLVDGASIAGAAASLLMPADVAILVSCVGRRLVLKQRVEDELEAVQEQLGAEVPLCGFYSYGEIAPFITHAKCELHNQTMTVTTLFEKDLSEI